MKMTQLVANFGRQAYFSYRALFLWLNWPAYISNVFLTPAVWVLMIVFTGRFAGNPDAANSFVSGMAAYSIPMIILGGVLQMFSYERMFGTLSVIYSSPGSRLVTYLSRGGLHYPNGLLTFAASIFCGWLLLDFDVSGTNWFSLLVAVLLVALSSTAFALFVGNFSMILRDFTLPGGPSIGITLVLTGVVIPRSDLPGVLNVLAGMLPVTHGLVAIRAGLAGTPIDAVTGDLLKESIVAAAYLALGYALYRVIEARVKRTGAFEFVD